jgi:hypothetical protein
MLERAIEGSPEARREHLHAMGSDCGYDAIGVHFPLRGESGLRRRLLQGLPGEAL